MQSRIRHRRGDAALRVPALLVRDAQEVLGRRGEPVALLLQAQPDAQDRAGPLVTQAHELRLLQHLVTLGMDNAQIFTKNTA